MQSEAKGQQLEFKTSDKLLYLEVYNSARVVAA
jgi:hypothetical protein